MTTRSTSGRPALAVTTRSHLKGAWLFPAMFIASMRVKRQLTATPGCLRFASIIAGPREFWTITVWESRDKMLNFMRSGAHEDIMWLFGKWLDSFWLTRWRPTDDERGRWRDLRLGIPPEEPEGPDLDPQQAEALEAALEHFPRLREATGPGGAPTYEHSPAVRRRRRKVEGAAGATVRIEVPHWWQMPRAWRDLAVLRDRLKDDENVLRWAVGTGRVREVYALAVLRDQETCERFLSHPSLEELRERWGDGCWSMRWRPANEFGHWDGLRLRSEKLGTSIQVPDAAAAAARYEDDVAER